MKRRRHTPEQVIRKLREADRMLGEGKLDRRRSRRRLEVSEPTYHRWRNQYGGMKADDAKRLRELERENARLKRIVADQALGDAGAEGGREGKLVSPARRRRAVADAAATASASASAGRAGSSGQHRSTQRHEPDRRRRRRGAAGAAARDRRPSGRGGGIAARTSRLGELGLAREPQAGAAAVARGGPAGPAAAAQAPAARRVDRPGRPAAGRAARSRVGDRLPVRPDRRRPRAEAAQHRRRVHPRGARDARRATASTPTRPSPCSSGSPASAARPRMCAATTAPS